MSLEDTLYPLLRIYEAAPQPVRSLAGRAYRAIPASLRYGQSYTQFQREAHDVESWNAEMIRAYQIKAVRGSLIAAAQAPFYAERFEANGVDPQKFEALEQLKDYPLLTKQDLIEQRERMVNPHLDASQWLYITTGGSSGVPVGFYLHKGVSRPKEQAYLEAQWSRRGYRVGDRVAVIRGGVTSGRANGDISYYDASRDSLVLSSSHLSEQRAGEYVDALNRFRPRHLNIYPSSALMLAKWLEVNGRRLDFDLVSVLCGSEKLSDESRHWLQEIFRAPVYHWYGHSERVVIAGQGRSGDHLYFCPTYGFVEFGEPDADGLREVIGTSFHNHVMPLIRYRTGDRVRLAEDDAAERELPFPEISEVAGRDYEFVVSATGRRISLTAINMHDGTFDGTCAVQFAQMAPGVIECRYVRAMGGPPVNEELMRSGLMRKLGDDFDLRLRAVRETEKSPNGKHRWLASATKPKEEETPQPDIHLNAITFHDAKAGEWEKLYQRPSFQLRRKVIMDLLRPSLSKPGHWLDAGCGSGYFSRELARAGCDVTGVDAAAGMVEESCTRAEAEGMRDHTTFAVVDSIERLPFADATFDGVLCSSVVEYVPDAATALHELSRVLRPGGHALITVPNRYAISRVAERAVFNVTRRVSSTPWPRYLRHSRWHYSSDMMQKALAAQGLKVVATDYFGPAQPAWLNRNAVCGMMLAVLAVKQ